MTFLHRYFGLVLAALFLILFFWGIGGWVTNRHPGKWFWRILAVAQVGLAGPAITGIALFVIGGRPHLLHFAYGLFPVIVLLVAHRFSRRFEGLEWTVFAIAGLVNFGLLTRGFMTG